MLGSPLMSYDESPSIARRDWRLHAITTTAAPSVIGGRSFPAGTPVELISPVSFADRMLIAPVANPPALYLSLAGRLSALARPTLKALRRLPETGTPSARQAHQVGDATFFTCLENLIGCVVFSFTALEAFANEAIPDGYVFKRPRADNKCDEVYTKEQVERGISLDLKLGRILPDLLAVPSPKGGKLWEYYVEIKELRDRLVHLKSADMKAAQEPDLPEYLWSLLLRGQVLSYPVRAKAMMAYFYGKKPPRWLARCPLKEST